jgi:DNA replication protein DnaC
LNHSSTININNNNNDSSSNLFLTKYTSFEEVSSSTTTTATAAVVAAALRHERNYSYIEAMKDDNYELSKFNSKYIYI